MLAILAKKRDPDARSIPMTGKGIVMMTA